MHTGKRYTYRHARYTCRYTYLDLPRFCRLRRPVPVPTGFAKDMRGVAPEDLPPQPRTEVKGRQQTVTALEPSGSSS